MKIVIVGGGISGWISALIFSHRQPNHKYAIVESPEIDTIGVGEGTTGLFSDVIDEIPDCLLYTSPSPRDLDLSRMPSSA